MKGLDIIQDNSVCISYLFTAEFLNKFLEFAVDSEFRIELKKDDVYHIGIKKMLREDYKVDEFMNCYSDTDTTEYSPNSKLTSIVEDNFPNNDHGKLVEQIKNNKGKPFELFIDIIFLEVGHSKLIEKYFKTVDLNVLRAWTKQGIDSDLEYHATYIGPPSPIRQIPSPVQLLSAELHPTTPSSQKDSAFSFRFWDKPGDVPVGNIFALFKSDKNLHKSTAITPEKIPAVSGKNPMLVTQEKLNDIMSPTCIPRGINEINLTELKFALHQLYNWMCILLVVGIEGRRRSWVNSQILFLPIAEQKVIFKWCILEVNYGDEEFKEMDGWSEAINEIKSPRYNLQNESADFKEGGFLSISSSKNSSPNWESSKEFITIRSKPDALNIEEFKKEVRSQLEKEMEKDISLAKEEFKMKIRNEIDREVYEQQKLTQEEMKNGFKENITKEVTQKIEQEFKEKLNVIKKKTTHDNNEHNRVLNEKTLEVKKLEKENEELNKMIKNKEEKINEILEASKVQKSESSEKEIKLFSKNSLLLEEKNSLQKSLKEKDAEHDESIFLMSETNKLKVLEIETKLQNETNLFLEEISKLKMSLEEKYHEIEEKDQFNDKTESNIITNLKQEDATFLGANILLKKIINEQKLVPIKIDPIKRPQVSENENDTSTENEKLLKENNEMKSIIQAKDDDSANLKSTIDKLEATIDTNKEKYLKIKDRMNNMVELLTTKTHELNDVSKEKEDLNIKFLDNLKAIEDLNRILHEKELQLQDASNKTEEMKMKVDLYNSNMIDMANLQNENIDLRKFIKSIKYQMKDVLTILKINDEHDTVEEIWQCVLGKVGELVTENDFLKVEVDGSLKKFQSIEDEKHKLINEIKIEMAGKLKQKTDEYNKNINEESMKYNKASDLLIDIDSKVNSILQVFDLNNNLKLELPSKLNIITEATTSVLQKFTNQLTESKHLTEIKKNMEHELQLNKNVTANLEQNKRELEKTVEVLNLKEGELNLHINELRTKELQFSKNEDTIKELKLKLDTSNNNKENLEVQFKNLHGEYNKLKIEHDTKSKKLDHLNNQLKSCENEAKIFEETSKSLEAVVEKMTDELFSVNNQTVKVQEERCVLETDINAFKLEIEKYQEEIQRLKEELKSNDTEGTKLNELMERYNLVDNERKKFQDQLTKSQRETQKLIGFKNDIETERNKSKQLMNQLEEIQNNFDKLREDDDLIIEGLDNQLRLIKKTQLEKKGNGEIGGYLEGKIMIEVLKQLQQQG